MNKIISLDNQPVYIKETDTGAHKRLNQLTIVYDEPISKYTHTGRTTTRKIKTITLALPDEELQTFITMLNLQLHEQ